MGSLRDFVEHSVLREINQSNQDIWTASISYLNDKGWQLDWGEENDMWCLYSQNNIIFTSSIWLSIPSFVYGMILSTISALTHMNFPPRTRNYRPNDYDDTSSFKNYSIAEVFEKLIDVNQHILEYETRRATPGRAHLIYGVFQRKEYELKDARFFQTFATFYKRKLILETRLKVLSEEGVNLLKSASRNLQPVQLGQHERLPIALAFVFLHLEKKSVSWYNVVEKWYYFEGDQLIFTAEDRGDFEAFILGMAYNYARLPDEVLEQYIKGSLRDRMK